MVKEIPLLAIIGPTASGKSAVAMEIARRCGAEIISVDSMQIYREMDIGTAKPTANERTEIQHHLLDVANPDESFSVARFVEMADAAIADARRRGKQVIVTGGTPMYFKALFDGLFDGPGADEAIRARLTRISNEELHQQLTRIDPIAASRIDRADQKRLIRALEVYELTGQTISSLQQQWQGERQTRHPATWIGLLWDKDVLNRRINARVKQMMEAGWLEEVRALRAKYPTFSKTAGEATGYRELLDVARGGMKLDDAIEQIKIGTRQLARRQMKWLRRFADVHWLAGDHPVEQNADEAMNWWGLK